jgi:hypothetical protein
MSVVAHLCVVPAWGEDHSDVSGRTGTGIDFAYRVERQRTDAHCAALRSFRFQITPMRSVPRSETLDDYLYLNRKSALLYRIRNAVIRG